ncbi:MAG: N-acyl homoserine lactonase family protein [Gemmatimonadota bacterium]
MLSSLLISLSLLVSPTPPPVYRAYAVQYGVLAGFPKRYLMLGADTTERVDVALMVWVLRGGGRTILVDAGFYRDQFMTQWKPRDYVRPSEAVARLGIKPGDVTDVIISHSHWDHADGADLFPNAKVWVQKTEYEFYRDPKNQANTGVYPADMAMFAGIAKAGRLMLVAGDSQTVAPGVVVYIGGRHTKESQYVSAPIQGGTVVIASDNAYLYDNLNRKRPIAATWDTLSNLSAQARMFRLASERRFVIPGHDPLVMTRFPVVVPGVVEIK